MTHDLEDLKPPLKQAARRILDSQILVVEDELIERVKVHTQLSKFGFTMSQTALK